MKDQKSHNHLKILCTRLETNFINVSVSPLPPLQVGEVDPCVGVGGVGAGRGVEVEHAGAGDLVPRTGPGLRPPL